MDTETLSSRDGSFTTLVREWRGEGTVYTEIAHRYPIRTERTQRAARRLAMRNDPRAIRSHFVGVRYDNNGMVYRFVTYRSN